MSKPCQSPSLSYFNKMAQGSVPTDGYSIVKKALENDLMTKADIAAYLGVQEKQVAKKAGSLTPIQVRGLCSHIIAQNGPAI